MSRFTGFDSPEHIARFLAFMALPRSEIIAGIRSMYPDVDAETIADEVLLANKSEVTRRIVEERERAIASEHDLSQSIHDQER